MTTVEANGAIEVVDPVGTAGRPLSISPSLCLTIFSPPRPLTPSLPPSCRSWRLGGFVFLAIAVCIGVVPLRAIAADRVPVIYSTDLLHPHDDPDDHYDLATLMALPQLDVQAVVLDLGERQKARNGMVPVEQMIRLTGRRFPYSTGLAEKLKSPTDTALDQPRYEQQGVELILRAIRSADRPVTIITAGSLRDTVAAFNREPGLFRARVARLYINIGTAATTGPVEWNVTLDANAFVRLTKSGLPVYWCPCLPMGDDPHSTYWRFKQGEVLDGLPRPLLNFFVYALQQVPVKELDPLDALSMDLRPFRHLLASTERNMWCTASFIDAAGLCVVKKNGRFVMVEKSEKAAATPIFEFVPARVDIDEQGKTKAITPDPQATLRVFTAADHAQYNAAMTECLKTLLQRFPASQPAK